MKSLAGSRSLRAMRQKLSKVASLDQTTQRALRGMAKLATGATGAKLIALASLPFVTRIYTPDNMGALAVFAGFVMLLGPLLTLQYRQALPVPRSDAVAMNLLALCALLTLGMSTFLLVLLLLGAPPLLGALSMEVLVPWWWLLPVAAFLYAVYTVLQLWSTRRRQYRTMAQAELLQSAVGNGAKIALGFVWPPPLGLLVGHAIAQCGGIVMLMASTGRDVRRLLPRVSLRRIGVAAWRHRGFPLFRMPSQLLLMLSSQAPVFFMAAYFGPAVAGQFALANMALSMPMNLIGRNMGKAYFGEVAHLGRAAAPEIRRSILAVTRLLGAVGLLMALLLVFAAPPLFLLIFGAQWAEAGSFAAILAIFVTFQFATAPVMNVLSVFHREDIYLQLNAQRLAIVGGVIWAAHLFAFSAAHTLLTYSLLLSAHYIVAWLRVLSVISTDTNQLTAKI